eukprot:2594403-Heterocapsa_arctica.AAC.1
MKWWMCDGVGPGVTFESLADSGEDRFKSLDIKVSASLGKIIKIANNSLTQELQLLEQAVASTGGMLMGRQIAYIIYTFCQTSPNMDFTYGIEDLSHLKWSADGNISRFLFCWRLIISKMRTQLGEVELGEILYLKMQNST